MGSNVVLDPTDFHYRHFIYFVFHRRKFCNDIKVSKLWEFSFFVWMIPFIRLNTSVAEFTKQMGERKIKTKALKACCFSLPHNPVIQRHPWCMMGETSPTQSYKCMQHASLRYEQCPLSLASPHAAHAEKHAGKGTDRCLTVCAHSEGELRRDTDDSHIWRIYSKLAMSLNPDFFY